MKRNFQQGRVILAGIDDQFDADLASLIYYADDNDGYKYLLVVIDIFSRYAWVQPLKDKTAPQIGNAFDNILSEDRIPKKLHTDAAKDFTSEKFQTFLKGKNIVHFVTHNEKQANYVERFIKTLKYRYIDVLQKIVTSYNHAWHSGIRSESVNVNKQNEKQLWWQMYWPKEPYVKKKKKEKKNLLSILEIELELHTLEDIFNMNMIQNGLVKFLKFLDSLYIKVNLYTI